MERVAVILDVETVPNPLLRVECGDIFFLVITDVAGHIPRERRVGRRVDSLGLDVIGLCGSSSASRSANSTPTPIRNFRRVTVSNEHGVAKSTASGVAKCAASKNAS